MGMFDRIMVPCGSCQTLLEFQSKAGDCELAEYTLDTLPQEIAGDILGDAVTCKCGRITVLRGAMVVSVAVSAVTVESEGYIKNSRWDAT